MTIMSSEQKSSPIITPLHKRITFSLQAKVILTFVLMVVISNGVGAFVSSRNTATTLSAQVSDNLNNLAQSSAVNIGDLLARQVNALQTLSLNRSLHDRLRLANTSHGTNPAEIQAELDRLDQQWIAADDADIFIRRYQANAPALELTTFRETFPAHVEVFITDQHGGLLATTNRTSDYYQADEEWWQVAFNDGQGGIYIGEPELDESSNTIAINIAVPVYDVDTNEVIGILRTTYDLNALTESLAQSRFAETGRIDLLVSGGQLITVESDREFEIVELEATHLAELQEAIGTTSEFEFDGELALVVQAPVVTTIYDPAIGDLGWRLIVHQDRSEAFAIVDQQTRNTAWLLMGIVIVAGAIAFVLGRQLANPIRNLTNIVTRFTTGDLQARAAIQSNDETGVLAASFNQMAEQLQQTLEGLEQRVAERTRALETSGEVSRSLSTILDEKQLVSEVVEQVRSAFDYYYAHIYTFDETKEKLIMAGGTGQAGRTMLARGHSIPKGKGLVGRAAETNNIVLVSDVSQEPGWLPNPLLPDTKAEVAVPIAIGDEVLGVLDVQHNISGGLGQGEAALIQSIANQVAVALRNARSYEVAQRQADREALVNTINQKIQGAGSIEEVLQTAVRELGQALGTERASIQLSRAATRPRLRTTVIKTQPNGQN